MRGEAAHIDGGKRARHLDSAWKSGVCPSKPVVAVKVCESTLAHTRSTSKGCSVSATASDSSRIVCTLAWFSLLTSKFELCALINDHGPVNAQHVHGTRVQAVRRCASKWLIWKFSAHSGHGVSDFTQSRVRCGTSSWALSSACAQPPHSRASEFALTRNCKLFSGSSAKGKRHTGHFGSTHSLNFFRRHGTTLLFAPWHAKMHTAQKVWRHTLSNRGSVHGSKQMAHVGTSTSALTLILFFLIVWRKKIIFI